jgi:predicted O-methyltransferase YrrM
LWETLATMLPGTPGQRNFLEIGSFEGRSAVWLMENAMQDGDALTCVDTWKGSEEHSQLNMLSVEEIFTNNIEMAEAKCRGRIVCAEKETSVEFLARRLYTVAPEGEFHFIYIDGSHIARHVLTDACMAWPLLKQGGLMVFDDYLWGENRDILHRPRLAVDMFVNLFAEELDIVHMGYQFVVRKK